MRFQSLGYFALVDVIKSPGVTHKIKNTVFAAKENGLIATENIYPTNFNGIAAFIKSLLISSDDVIVIRFSDLVFPIVFFVMLLLRLRGKKIVVDVPTPRVTGLKEMDSMIRSPLKLVLRKLISYASASWVLMPANLIIQYADEGRWFSMGLIKKTLKMGNGILLTDQIPLTKAVWPSKTLNLIAVAQLADWHGYDRMLYALSELKKHNLPCEIIFTIVGNGEALSFLKNLSGELGLDNVRFTGRLTGISLDKEFDNAHIGVASLGLYRVGLKEAAVLKTREYLVRGLSVIGVGSDPDFVSKNSKKFRFNVPNNTEIDQIVDLLLKVISGEIIFPAPIACREFAEENLNLKVKIKLVLSRLL